MANFERNSKKKKKKSLRSEIVAGREIYKQALEHHTRGELLLAEKAYRAAISNGFLCIGAFSNLGVICQKTDRLEEALLFYTKALEINPANPAVCLNLSSIYQDLGKLDQALSYALRALELKPECSTSLMNLGSIYFKLGYLDQALAITLKSLKFKPDNPLAHLNLGGIYEIYYQKNQALKHYLMSTELGHIQKHGSCVHSMILSLIILIELGRIKEAKARILSLPKLLSETRIYPHTYSAVQKKHDQGYFLYLKELLPEIPDISEVDSVNSIHIGESHCLAFVNQRISINGNLSKIKPLLIKGAKAWHLGHKQENNFKTCFQNSIKIGMDNYAFIFLSFGEIDCRGDEGILKHCLKYNHSVEAISQITAKQYVCWVANELSGFREKIILLGIPAPQKTTFSPGINSGEMNLLRLSVIRSFNEMLLSQCSKFGIVFADVFSLTRDEQGFNNNKWMIDNVHLKPMAIHEIIAHYLI